MAPLLYPRSFFAFSAVSAFLLLGTWTPLWGEPPASPAPESATQATAYYEREIRPLLVKHCYECHSERAKSRQGGLLLDRRSGWLQGGDTQMAVVPGNAESSLLIEAVRYQNEDLQMPPEGKLPAEAIGKLEHWVRLGAPGPSVDLADTEFSQLGNQTFLFEQAREHWAFQPIVAPPLPEAEDRWNINPVDRLIFADLKKNQLTPSPRAHPRILHRRVSFDLTGLPPRQSAPDQPFTPQRYEELVDRLIESPAFGEHIGRLWLDVARYADTDSFYRPDTRTPHYFPFAFTYRDYVVDAFNQDKPFDQFVREQLAADLMGFESDAPEMAALGFLTVGPHANRNATEALDDWIDATTRGLMGLTVACARCHDHKYEPIPTADYYALRGVFNSVVRINPLDEEKQPRVRGYQPSAEDVADYQKKRAAIDAKMDAAAGKKAKGNNRSVAQKIRETELAELLLFHPGAPAHTMIVRERPRPAVSRIFIRGDASQPGETVARRFLTLLDPSQHPLSEDTSGRLQLAEKITSPDNPLTARVFVNRVWGWLMGSPLVDTPSDFGLSGAKPSNQDLLDWLAADFVAHNWSVKHLVRTIVLSQAYQQSSEPRESMAALDPQNSRFWRAHRKHLSIEAIRDSMLAVAGQLDRTMRGRPAPLWEGDYTKRRSIYGFINRFNLDPTLRVFDFPTPMQTQPLRRESIVAPQSLFTMNSSFVIDQANAVVGRELFQQCKSDADRVQFLFNVVLQRPAAPMEITRVQRFLELQKRFHPADGATKAEIQNKFHRDWALVAQSLMMSNEFQYVD